MPRIVSIDVGTLEYGRDVQWLGDSPTQVATFVRVRLESGAEGTSVTWNDSPSATAMALAIEAWFGPALIGHDIRNHPAGTESLIQLAAWHATSSVAIAAIDNALWDAKGKFDQQPVHMLLDTRHKEVPAYAVSRQEMSMGSVEEVIDHIREFEELGYRGFKPHLWGQAKRDAKGCEAIRTAMGDEFELMFDPMGRYSLQDALEVGKVLQWLDYLWYEDPIPGIQRHAYPWLAQRLEIPIGATDALQWSITDYLDAASAKRPSRCALMRVVRESRSAKRSWMWPCTTACGASSMLSVQKPVPSPGCTPLWHRSQFPTTKRAYRATTSRFPASWFPRRSTPKGAFRRPRLLAWASRSIGRISSRKSSGCPASSAAAARASAMSNPVNSIQRNRRY
jgi:hypothetical protein